MKHIKRTLPILGLCMALLVLPGMTCKPSQQATAYKTLSTLQATTSGAYDAYLDLVVTGKLPTNSVPTVSRDYTVFLAVWNASVALAAQGTNSPATQPAMDAATRVLTDINLSKAPQ